MRIENDEKYGKYIPCDFCGGKRTVEDEDDIEAQIRVEGWIEYEDQNLCCGCIIRIAEIHQMEKQRCLIRKVIKDELRPLVRDVIREEKLKNR